MRLNAQIVRAAFTEEVMHIKVLQEKFDRSYKLMLGYLTANPQHFENLGGGNFRLLPFRSPSEIPKRERGPSYKEGYKEFYR